VLMAAGKLQDVCSRLIDAGRAPSTPAAVVTSATTSQQRTVTGTLITLPGLALAAEFGPPATLVVGEVAALATLLGGTSTGSEEAAAGR